MEVYFCYYPCFALSSIRSGEGETAKCDFGRLGYWVGKNDDTNCFNLQVVPL